MNGVGCVTCMNCGLMARWTGMTVDVSQGPSVLDVVVTEKSLTSHLAHNMSFQGRVFLTGPSSPARTSHTSVYIIEYNCGTQNCTEQF